MKNKLCEKFRFNKIVQCQVVLMRPKTNEMWNNRRGLEIVFFYYTLRGLQEPLVSVIVLMLTKLLIKNQMCFWLK